jgi:hypothetical protein
VTRRKSPHAGRHKERKPFIMLPRALLVDSVWTNLPATARVIFLDMCKIHRHGGARGPGNNGYVGYGCAAGARAANISVATAHRMLSLIRKSDLVKLRKEGSFKVKAGEGRTREWEITIYPIDSRPPIAWSESRLHIEHWLLASAGYKGLSNSAKCILIELMRRYDGGNNGYISFGGPSGAHAGFSNDVTERALTELQRAGFIVQTARAVPHLRRSRKWRLTMYAAEGKSGTKDFMQDPRRTTPQKSYRGFTGAVDSAQNVSTMRASTSSNLSAPSKMAAFREENSAYTKRLSERALILDSRAGETFDAADTRTNEIHVEAIPQASCKAEPSGSHLSALHLAPTGSNTVVRTWASAKTMLDQPAGLFGDALPSMPTPLDQLRVELRGVLARKRGTQSRLAEALGLSRQKFANALSGREGFTGTSAAALRRWLAGEPISEDWPSLPSATEKPNAA